MDSWDDALVKYPNLDSVASFFKNKGPPVPKLMSKFPKWVETGGMLTVELTVVPHLWAWVRWCVHLLALFIQQVEKSRGFLAD